MVYSIPSATTPIRQGDIFKKLPLTRIDLNDIRIIDQDSPPQTARWEEVNNREEIVATLKVEPVYGIVVSQDCDNLRSDAVSFAQIDDFTTITGQNPTTTLNWAKLLVKGPYSARYHWFYLPENRRIGFTNKKAANFDVLFQVNRETLLSKLASMRIARINDLALNHFRDTLVKYFTRYAHNEWYALNKNEFREYKNNIVSRDPEEEPNIIPYPHQRP